MVKPMFFFFGSWIIAASNQTKPWWFIFLFITTAALVKFLIFWTQQVASHFLLGSHLTVQFHLIRVKNVVVVRTFSPNIFSHGMVQCVQWVSLHGSGIAGKHIVLKLGIGTWWQKIYFSQVKTGELQPQTCQKNSVLFFSLHYNNSCSHNFEIKRMLPTSGLKVKLTVQFHVIRGTTRMGVKTHRTLSPDIFFFLMEWSTVSLVCLCTTLKQPVNMLLRTCE